MIDGALLLPEIRVGMIEASAVARNTAHPQSLIDDRQVVLPHLAGTDRVVGRFRRRFHPIENFIVLGQSRQAQFLRCGVPSQAPS